MIQVYNYVFSFVDIPTSSATKKNTAYSTFIIPIGNFTTLHIVQGSIGGAITWTGVKDGVITTTRLDAGATKDITNFDYICCATGSQATGYDIWLS